MAQLPDEIKITWNIDDVKRIAEDLTDDECRQVLQFVKNEHDANEGITWQTLEFWADKIKAERTKEN